MQHLVSTEAVCVNSFPPSEHSRIFIKFGCMPGWVKQICVPIYDTKYRRRKRASRQVSIICATKVSTRALHLKHVGLNQFELRLSLEGLHVTSM